MLKSLLFVAVATALTAAAPSPSANIFEVNITPEQAAQLINSPPFTDPQLSGRTAILPLVRYDDPRFRTAEAGPSLGHYWRNGKEIENTGDYDEEVYDVAQYHGQDGVGGYGYGYKGPDSAKVENRIPSGDVTGSYVFKAGKDLIKVRYWADSQGFHQEDNLPKVALQPTQESEDVRQARLAHEKAWQEAANAAAQQPDPQGEYYAEQDQGVRYDTAASEPHQSSVAAPQEGREGKSYYAASGQSNFLSGQQARAQSQVYQGQGQGQNQASQGQVQGQYQASQGQYQASQGQPRPQGQGYGQGQQASAQAHYQSGGQEPSYHGKYEDDEPHGPPRGFFYSFNYPASIIVPKNAAGEHNQEPHPGHPVDYDTVGVNSQYH